MGLVQAQSGPIYYNGTNITRLPTHEIVKCGISLAPEGGQLFAPLSVLDNSKFAPRLRISKVITDLPLAADAPIEFGVMEFCEVGGSVLR